MNAKKTHLNDDTLPEDVPETLIEPENDTEDSVVIDETAIEGKLEEDVTVQLEQAENRATEYLDNLKRERATFQNYKKRVERERIEQGQLVRGYLLLKLLPTLDDFCRAMEAVPEAERDEWFEGVALIQRKFERFLEDESISEIPALGEPFDPNFHEAVGVDPDTEAESGSITQVLQRGYMHGERMLRPALVRVAE